MFKNNDVVRYRAPDGWCRHGIAIIHNGEGWGYAKDTYWGVNSTSSDSGWITEAHLKEPVLMGNLDEFEPSQYKECRDYLEQDQFYIPTGGGFAQIWYRKGAVPDPTNVYNRLQYEIEKAESGIQSATWKREYAVKRMNEHIAKYGSPNNGKEETDAVL